MNKNPEKFAIEFIIRNGHKLEEENNNLARQVVKLAIEALEKQIAKEIIDDSAFGLCPNCKEEFNSELISEYSIKHCPYCGQRLII